MANPARELHDLIASWETGPDRTKTYESFRCEGNQPASAKYWTASRHAVRLIEEIDSRLVAIGQSRDVKHYRVLIPLLLNAVLLPQDLWNNAVAQVRFGPRERTTLLATADFLDAYGTTGMSIEGVNKTLAEIESAVVGLDLSDEVRLRIATYLRLARQFLEDVDRFGEEAVRHVAGDLINEVVVIADADETPKAEGNLLRRLAYDLSIQFAGATPAGLAVLALGGALGIAGK